MVFRDGGGVDLTASVEYEGLIGNISEVYIQGRLLAHQVVNAQITETYWQIGRHIVEFEQGGTAKAKYGKALMVNLAKDLSLRLGKGFSRSNLIRFRQFYLAFPIRATLSHELSWSHIVELLKIDDAQERGFYKQQAMYSTTISDRGICTWATLPTSKMLTAISRLSA